MNVKPRVIFIANALSQQRIKKRVSQFAQSGYYVKVYGFSRDLDSDLSDWAGNPEVIGRILSTDPYIHRLKIIRRGIKSVLTKERQRNTIFYVFQLDLALIFTTLTSQKYIYEESDLMHTGFSKPFLRSVFEFIDKRIINKSLCSVFTSDGFIRYHFDNNRKSKYITIPNKLSPGILALPKKGKAPRDKMAIGFVGFVRYQSVFNFAKVVGERFPDMEFHFFGDIMLANKELFNRLDKYDNVRFHGGFSNPKDLPEIYSNIDLLVSTYDANGINERVSEPNKLYEALYFDTPIVVSKKTLLAEKTIEYGVGYEINALDESEIEKFLANISFAEIKSISKRMASRPKEECISSATPIFEYIEKVKA